MNAYFLTMLKASQGESRPIAPESESCRWCSICWRSGWRES